MRKHTKILTLLLLLALIISVFAVVALADDSSAPETELLPVTSKTDTFQIDSYVHGSNYSNVSNKDGRWVVHVADNGNKYIVAQAEDVEGTNTQENIDPVTARNAELQNIWDYPTVAFDFDIRSTSGSFGSVSLRPDLYGGLSSTYRLTQGQSMYLSELSSAGLKKVNEWQHVTMIVTHLGNGSFGYYFYVDGVLSTYTTTKNYSLSNSGVAFSSNDARNTGAGITDWDSLVAYVEANPSCKTAGIGVFSIYACGAGSR